jgi:hypothetical protein
MDRRTFLKGMVATASGLLIPDQHPGVSCAGLAGVRGPGAYTEPGAVYAHLRGAMMGDTILGLICVEGREVHP